MFMEVFGSVALPGGGAAPDGAAVERDAAAHRKFEAMMAKRPRSERFCWFVLNSWWACLLLGLIWLTIFGAFAFACIEEAAIPSPQRFLRHADDLGRGQVVAKDAVVAEGPDHFL